VEIVCSEDEFHRGLMHYVEDFKVMETKAIELKWWMIIIIIIIICTLFTTTY
ncbi:MAG: hypothetical protein ACI8QQ_001508, partial [Psychroserpens sp.]